MLQGRNFLSIEEFTSDEINQIFALAIKLKDLTKREIKHRLLEGKTIAMIFQKPSNRTRLSFEVGISQLGASAITVRNDEIQMGGREPIQDVARTISRYVDGVVIRANSHKDIEQFAKFASVPVINGLSDESHPCQAMADLLTIYEHKKALRGKKLVYIGDGNNVCYSLVQLANILGLKTVVSCPKGYEPLNWNVEGICKTEIVYDPIEAAHEADVIYTDVWTSMGQEEEREKRLREFSNYTIDNKIMKSAKTDAIFMHCLPAHRGEEVSGEVFESGQSVVFDQAENRLHAQKAILALVIEGAIVF